MKTYKSPITKYAYLIGIFGIGFVIGATLFTDSRPRSFTALTLCNTTCLNPNELTGMLVSIGITKLGSPLPKKIFESDKIVVIEHPFPQAKLHYVILPKKDIKNIADVSDDDQVYVLEMLKYIGQVVREKNLIHYKVISNGPGEQLVSYLHFHLLAE